LYIEDVQSLIVFAIRTAYLACDAIVTFIEGLFKRLRKNRTFVHCTYIENGDVPHAAVHTLKIYSAFQLTFLTRVFTRCQGGNFLTPPSIPLQLKITINDVVVYVLSAL